jgi:hypothetical protein
MFHSRLTEKKRSCGITLEVFVGKEQAACGVAPEIATTRFPPSGQEIKFLKDSRGGPQQGAAPAAAGVFVSVVFAVRDFSAHDIPGHAIVHFSPARGERMCRFPSCRRATLVRWMTKNSLPG